VVRKRIYCLEEFWKLTKIPEIKKLISKYPITNLRLAKDIEEKKEKAQVIPKEVTPMEPTTLKLNKLTLRIQELEKQLNAKNAEISTMKSRITELETENSNLKNKIKTLKSKAKSQKKAFNIRKEGMFITTDIKLPELGMRTLIADGVKKKEIGLVEIEKSFGIDKDRMFRDICEKFFLILDEQLLNALISKVHISTVSSVKTSKTPSKIIIKNTS
jgi:predicted RNase H-like nuclease (RuvC/YqgF family)